MGELKTTVPAEVAQEIDWNKSGLRGGRLWQVLAGARFCFAMVAKLEARQPIRRQRVVWQVRIARYMTAHPAARRRLDKSRISCECEITR